MATVRNIKPGFNSLSPEDKLDLIRSIRQSRRVVKETPIALKKKKAKTKGTSTRARVVRSKQDVKLEIFAAIKSMTPAQKADLLKSLEK